MSNAGRTLLRTNPAEVLFDTGVSTLVSPPPADWVFVADIVDGAGKLGGKKKPSPSSSLNRFLLISRGWASQVFGRLRATACGGQLLLFEWLAELQVEVLELVELRVRQDVPFGFRILKLAGRGDLQDWWSLGHQVPHLYSQTGGTPKYRFWIDRIRNYRWLIYRILKYRMPQNIELSKLSNNLNHRFV